MFGQIERQRYRRGETEAPRDDSKAIDREAAGCDLLRDAGRRGDEQSESGRYSRERVELATGDVHHAVRKEAQKQNLYTAPAISTATNSANPSPTSDSVGRLRPTDDSGLRSTATTRPRITAVAISWYAIFISDQHPYCDIPVDSRSELSRVPSGLSRMENPTASPRKVVK